MEGWNRATIIREVPINSTNKWYTGVNPAINSSLRFITPVKLFTMDIYGLFLGIMPGCHNTANNVTALLLSGILHYATLIFCG